VPGVKKYGWNARFPRRAFFASITTYPNFALIDWNWDSPNFHFVKIEKHWDYENLIPNPETEGYQNGKQIRKDRSGFDSGVVYGRGVRGLC
jgi:hypothetical protein